MEPRIEIPPRNLAAELELADELVVDPALARVLRARGIGDVAAASRFLFPDLSRLTPPEDFPDLPEAAALVVRACEEGKKFYVAGDYDVDGLTATALLAAVLGRLGAETEYYIPNRLSEGYDLTEETARRASEAGAQVLVTADCGSRAHEAVRAARQAGLDVVVTDHHRLGATLPPANAVVTPQRLPASHPARGFAGVGVAYKLAREVIRQSGADFAATDFLPLVALGTVCDVVDLTRENRVLAAAGLAAFPGESFPGLAALAAGAGVAPPVSSWHLAFIVGPRLNAAGRLGHADYALELLLARDEERGRALARKLEGFNKRRRAFEERVAGAALERGAAQVKAGRKSIVISGEGWHPGVIGIAAARLVERFYRPTVLVAMEGGRGRGSCRSIPPFDIYAALCELKGYLGRFGGHRSAAGFEIEAAAVPPFAEALEALAAERLDDDALRPTIRVDGRLPLRGATVALAEDLALLEPAGEGNPPATYLTETFVGRDSQRVFKKAHLEITAVAPQLQVRAIGFNLADAGEALEPGRYGLVHTPTVDRWRDRERVQLRLTYVAPWAAGGDAAPAEVVDMRGRGRQEAGFALEPSDDAVYGLPAQRELAGRSEFVAYVDYAPGGRRWRRLWLAAPPFDLYRLATFFAAAEEVVFAFADGCVPAARECLARYYPSRETLAALYRELRDGGSRASEDADAGTRRALAIFEELGLIEEMRGTMATPEDEPRWGSAARRALDESPTFRRCERRRRAAEEFINGMCRWPLPVLRDLAEDVSRSARDVDAAVDVPLCTRDKGLLGRRA